MVTDNEHTSEELKDQAITIVVNGKETTFEPNTALHDHYLRDLRKAEEEEFNLEQDNMRVLCETFIASTPEIFENPNFIGAIAIKPILEDEKIVGWEPLIRRHHSMVRAVQKLVLTRRTKEEIEEDSAE